MTGKRGMAAFAFGDPDTADHISVTTPGVGTTINGSFDSMTEEAVALKLGPEQALAENGRDDTVATIGWLGYEPPVQNGPGNVHIPWVSDNYTQDIGRGWGDAGYDSKAGEAAPKLASFYEGLDVASTTGQPDVTAIGHSYGSLTTGYA